MEPDPSLDLEAEIELLRRIGAGDLPSFEELYRRFSGMLFATIFRILNQQEAAEDVLQEVFLQIWEKAPLYDPVRGKPLTWIVTLARNKAIDRLRSTQRSHRLQSEVEREAQAFDPAEERNSADALEAVEQGKLVREAVQKLSKDQREAISLAFFSGLTQTEIAERVGEPLGTVKARIRRGMMRLREVLKNRV
jgi:RNA polymerase sigma-70 factor (ECF subfamily)